MNEKKNILGLDMFQMTIIKSNYQSQKKFISQREKVHQKITQLLAEESQLDDMLESMDVMTHKITKEALGFQLSSAQCMEFLKDPQKLEDYKKGIGLIETPSMAPMPESEAPQEY